MSKEANRNLLHKRLRKKLSAWKAKLLSIGGKLTPCKTIHGESGNLGRGSLGSDKGGTWDKITKIHQATEKVNLPLISLFSKRLGKGNDTKFWTKAWCSEETVGSCFPRLVAIDVDRNFLVPNRVKLKATGTEFFGCWRRPLRDGIELRELEEIRRIRAFDDMWLRRCGPETKWNTCVPVKVRVHLWRLRLDRLPTRDNLARKGIELENYSFRLCHGHSEPRDHLFLSCSKEKEVRIAVNAWWKLFSVEGGRLDEILYRANNSETNSNKRRLIEDTLVHAYLWLIWKGRNEVIFNNAHFNPSLIANHIQATACFWIHNRSSFGKLFSWSD
ncbi:hypothetical protein OSB04_028020 [Centaurea solstitialis]|uniref:Reverse transcriptase zinc-binding domain-containing protein n=1 Tax=Centaurea solstitialis TaxID=347529 RepID=A0AA38SEQ2_9ASTR|nr:hypothetical protein OSB04_028020 [Centaurea solstitialis]